MIGNSSAHQNRLSTAQRVLDLGPREVSLLSLLWQLDEATAKQIYDAIDDRTIAVNTIHSALERLRRKGLVERSKRSGSFFYRAAFEQSALIACSIRATANKLTNGDKGPMIEGIAEYLGYEFR